MINFWILVFAFLASCQAHSSVQFSVKYSVADPKEQNKFVDKKYVETAEDPYESKEAFKKYFYSKNKKRKTSFNLTLAMDSKLNNLELNGDGVFRVEYEFSREAIVYDNFVHGGSFRIESFAGLQKSLLKEIKGSFGGYDLRNLTADQNPFSLPPPENLKKHCKNFDTFPCSTRVYEIRLFISKQIPVSLRDLAPSESENEDQTKIWVPLFDIVINVVPSYDNEKNFYDGHLPLLKSVNIEKEK